MFIASHKWSSRVDFRCSTGAAADPFLSRRLMNHRPASAIMKARPLALCARERDKPGKQRMREAGIKENARDKWGKEKKRSPWRERIEKKACAAQFLRPYRPRCFHRTVGGCSSKAGPVKSGGQGCSSDPLGHWCPPPPPRRELDGKARTHARTDWCRTQRDLLVRER